MASITVSAKITLNETGQAVSAGLVSAITTTGVEHSHQELALPTSYTAIPVGNVTHPAYCCLYNKSTAATMSVTTDADGTYPVTTLPAGTAAVIVTVTGKTLSWKGSEPGGLGVVSLYET